MLKITIIFCALHCALLNPQVLIQVPYEQYDPYFETNDDLLQLSNTRNDVFAIGDCRIVIQDTCPDPDVTFYLYSKQHLEAPERIRIGANLSLSNITDSAFISHKPSKIIIHGYNSDMFLNVLEAIRKEYLLTNDMNVFAVDWALLAQGPCYPAAVWNARHVGKCGAQLVRRMRELGAADIHVIGFSLGAQVANFVANELRPYKLPRITGLDPAMPGFITVSNEYKLDKGDAEFVDVVHTNAFIQGKVEQCGHVDFYFNGGVIQPGCWAEQRFFACNHHRAPQYFAESINSRLGFYGWPCPSYIMYLLAECPPRDPQALMGEHVSRSARGLHLVITNSVAPFAVGRFTGPAIEIFLRSEATRLRILEKFKKELMETLDEHDLLMLKQDGSM